MGSGQGTGGRGGDPPHKLPLKFYRQPVLLKQEHHNTGVQEAGRIETLGNGEKRWDGA